MRLGYFGGSFDPPHLGHLAIARAAAHGFSLDEVLFVPAGRQPLKPGGSSASFADRLAMIELLCRHQPRQGRPRFTPSELEAPRPGNLPNYTADTLSRLRAQLSAADSLFVLVGADAFLGVRRWSDSDRLFSLADWIVVSRPGFPLQHIEALALSPEQSQRVHLLQGIFEPASATEIRRQLSHGGDCDGLLPPDVLAYIRARHLYGS